MSLIVGFVGQRFRHAGLEQGQTFYLAVIDRPSARASEMQRRCKALLNCPVDFADLLRYNRKNSAAERFPF